MTNNRTVLRGPVSPCIAVSAAFSLLLIAPLSPAADWPQWCGTSGKNMVSAEKDLPDSFVPGEKNSRMGKVDLATAKNVKWGRKLCDAIYSTPVIAGGRVFVGGLRGDSGVLLCLKEQTGEILWQWESPAKVLPNRIDGWEIGIAIYPRMLGVCSSPLVDGERVYFVTHDFKVLCLDVAGNAGRRKAKTVWKYDMWSRLGVFPSDAANGSPILDGDLLYVHTSNGIDRTGDPYREKFRKFPAPNCAQRHCPGQELRTPGGDGRPADRGPHVAWPVVFAVAGGSQRSKVGVLRRRRRPLLCLRGPAGSAAPRGAKLLKLQVAWSFDCNPAEYKNFGGLDWITHYATGDKRRTNGKNTKNDGSFVGMSEIVGTPVFFKNRVYVAIGRDPEHGRGRGALQCIDAAQSGDITHTGKIWTYQGLDRTLSTVSIAGGLLYVCDVAGHLHCVDAESGEALGPRSRRPALGFHAGRRRQGFHAHRQRPGNLGGGQAGASSWPGQIRLAALFLACRGQRHVVRGDADRLDVGRGQAAVAALARRSP